MCGQQCVNVYKYVVCKGMWVCIRVCESVQFLRVCVYVRVCVCVRVFVVCKTVSV